MLNSYIKDGTKAKDFDVLLSRVRKNYSRLTEDMKLLESIREKEKRFVRLLLQDSLYYVFNGLNLSHDFHGIPECEAYLYEVIFHSLLGGCFNDIED